MKFRSKETKGFLHVERHPGLIWNVDTTIPDNLCEFMDTLELTNVEGVVCRVQAPRGKLPFEHFLPIRFDDNGWAWTSSSSSVSRRFYRPFPYTPILIKPTVGRTPFAEYTDDGMLTPWASTNLGF